MTATVTYREVALGDVIVGRDTARLYEVLSIEPVGELLRVSTWEDVTRQVLTFDLEPNRTCVVDNDRLTHCEKCNGSGVYAWGGTVNGKPVHEGECFRCGGKGKQDAADRKRNHNYDRYGIRL